MSAEIIVAIITSLASLIGVIITVCMGNNKTLYRIKKLEEKVEKHNQVVERVYDLETYEAVSKNEMKVVNHRIEDLERKL